VRYGYCVYVKGSEGSYKFGKASSWTSSYGSTSSISTTTSVSSESRQSSEYMEKLRELNQSVSSWISRHVKENPYVDLTPVFNDYRRYWNSIEATVRGKPSINPQLFIERTVGVSVLLTSTVIHSSL